MKKRRFFTSQTSELKEINTQQMAEVKTEVFRFRVCNITRYWDNDPEKFWSQMQHGTPCDGYGTKDNPLYKCSRCKVTVTPKFVTIENHKGTVIAMFESYLMLSNSLPPVLRMAAAGGLCYDNTPEGIAEFEKGE